MTIVCATHFSDLSLAAVRVAAQLSRTHGEELWLVEIVPPGAAGVGLTISAALAKEAAVHAAAGGVVHTEALAGPLAGAVERFCAARHAGLLVLGPP